MTACEIKEYIINNDCAEQILTELGCGHIKNHGKYLTASNPDNGDNRQAINLYLNDNLTCIDHTRNLTKNKRSHDIFDLISYFKNYCFSESLKWTCEILGIEYYGAIQEKPMSLQILQFLKAMSSENEMEDDVPLKPISKKILEYYLPYGNKMWQDEGISLETQRDFSIMYDPQSNRIVLPLYDELNTLVGIKGRLMKEKLDDWDQKYLYLTNFNKSKFVFGLNKTYRMIKQQGYCPIFEGEKSVMLGYDHGIGSVAVCGCKISQHQVNILTRLDVPLIICFDKDRTKEDIEYERNKFLKQIPIYCMIDSENLLNEKSSPIDDWNIWKILFAHNIKKI